MEGIRFDQIWWKIGQVPQAQELGVFLVELSSKSDWVMVTMGGGSKYPYFLAVLDSLVE